MFYGRKDTIVKGSGRVHMPTRQQTRFGEFPVLLVAWAPFTMALIMYSGFLAKRLPVWGTLLRSTVFVSAVPARPNMLHLNGSCNF